MNNLGFSDTLYQLLSSALPDYTVCLEPLPDAGSETVMGVGVFNVPEELVRYVTDLILDYDKRYCAGTPHALVPLVRGKQVTAAYYPQYACQYSLCESLVRPVGIPQAAASLFSRRCTPGMQADWTDAHREALVGGTEDFARAA